MSGSSRAYKILIIEDEPDIMELVTETLKSTEDHYDLLKAMEGEEGLHMALTANPDLILLDIMLPKLNGYEICRRLKSEAKTMKIPVVMLTAFGQKREIEEGFKVKADDYIVKPFDLNKLRQSVKRFLPA